LKLDKPFEAAEEFCLSLLEPRRGWEGQLWLPEADINAGLWEADAI
jgi:hypothetical protein